MRILAIDPGNVQTAIVLLDGDAVVHKALGLNTDVRNSINVQMVDVIVCEMVASYGMPVGRTIFDTVVWIGVYRELARGMGIPFHLVTRRDCKLHLCGSCRAKDSNVRQALLDAFPATGGGKTPQVGTKTQPGPLFGFAKDLWAALAVAITWRDMGQSAEYVLSSDIPLDAAQT